MSNQEAMQQLTERFMNDARFPRRDEARPRERGGSERLRAGRRG